MIEKLDFRPLKIYLTTLAGMIFFGLAVSALGFIFLVTTRDVPPFFDLVFLSTLSAVFFFVGTAAITGPIVILIIATPLIALAKYQFLMFFIYGILAGVGFMHGFEKYVDGGDALWGAGAGFFYGTHHTIFVYRLYRLIQNDYTH